MSDAWRRGIPLLVVAALVLGIGGWFLLHGATDDDPFADYCSEVEDRRGEIGAALGAGPQSGLIRALPSFEALAEKAPEDLTDEWSIVIARVKALQKALADAGVDPETYDAEKPPTGLAPDDQAAIKAAGLGLGSQEMALALSGVQQQARDVCKTPLSL